jgi:hypothetical protein
MTNTESDMLNYNLYRMDETRILIRAVSRSTTTSDFTVTLLENFVGTLNSILSAVEPNKMKTWIIFKHFIVTIWYSSTIITRKPN